MEHIISEMSMFIFENDELNEISLFETAKDYLLNNWGDKILPCHIDYILDEAYKIYEKI